jgi:hypothetical protein
MGGDVFNETPAIALANFVSMTDSISAHEDGCHPSMPNPGLAEMAPKGLGLDFGNYIPDP